METSRQGRNKPLEAENEKHVWSSMIKALFERSAADHLESLRFQIIEAKMARRHSKSASGGLPMTVMLDGNFACHGRL